MAGWRITDRVSCGEIYEILSRSLKVDPGEYVALVAREVGEGRAFPVLAGIVLSQNTSDKNSIRALKRLAERVGLSVESILSARLEDVEEAIRPSGLWKPKARAIVELARLVAEHGGEEYLVREDPMVLREELLKVRGVGPKTVDVFLSLVRRAPVFAVDTHAMRVALRWRLVEKKSYREASRALLECFGAERSDEAHRLIIALGRSYCRAKSPRCGDCPLKSYCPSSEA